MSPVSTPAPTQIRSLLITSRAAIKMLVVFLVIAAVPLALYVRVDSKSSKYVGVDSRSSSAAITQKTAISVRAAGRGAPFFKLQDGREMAVEYRGDESLRKVMQSGLAQPRSLASIDLDRNGTPDVLAGYAYNGAGILTLQRGNPDAFAPKSEDVFARLNQGYNPDALLPGADIIQIPEAAESSVFNVYGKSICYRRERCV